MRNAYGSKLSFEIDDPTVKEDLKDLKRGQKYYCKFETETIPPLYPVEIIKE
jgi:hypothetical protein